MAGILRMTTVVECQLGFPFHPSRCSEHLLSGFSVCNCICSLTEPSKAADVRELACLDRVNAMLHVHRRKWLCEKTQE